MGREGGKGGKGIGDREGTHGCRHGKRVGDWRWGGRREDDGAGGEDVGQLHVGC